MTCMLNLTTLVPTSETAHPHTDQKIGVVYTPPELSKFLTQLCKDAAEQAKLQVKNILDPACGEGALLKEAMRSFDNKAATIGIDIDPRPLQSISNVSRVYCTNTLIPDRKGTMLASEYWKNTLPDIDLVLANPPWTTEHFYDNFTLQKAGISMARGQYDAYELFIELSLQIVKDNGICGFIIPDSLFDSDKMRLREYLAQNTQLLLIARLGEKLFPGINRATTILIIKKTKPEQKSKTICFRLSTEGRKEVINRRTSLYEQYELGCHTVKQKRFLSNPRYSFDIDTKDEEESLLLKIRNQKYNLGETLKFSRGVEASKRGEIIICPFCGHMQKSSSHHNSKEIFACQNCKNTFEVTQDNVQSLIENQPCSNSHKIYVGEDVNRYRTFNRKYIKLDVDGIDYKTSDTYSGNKILIRKTGMGIKAVLDENNNYTLQTVYILKPLVSFQSSLDELYYYVALINSRIVYYYYLKVYGENEWKSHPYLTKEIIFTLPISKFEGSELDRQISYYSKLLHKDYDYDTDIKLEDLIAQKYKLNDGDRLSIKRELNKLPNLSAINEMKVV